MLFIIVTSCMVTVIAIIKKCDLIMTTTSSVGWIES